MNYNQDFFAQAQEVLLEVSKAKRPDILTAHGNIVPEIKSNLTPVTVLDQELEELYREALSKLDANIGFHGEELGAEGNTNTFWLIDPIDGTENLVRGLPNVRNMVTLIHNDEPVFAFVYRPISDELFVATKGGGAFKNGVRQQMVERPLNRSLLELSVPIDEPGAAEIWQAVFAKVFAFKISDFLHVVEGKLDGHIVYKSKGGIWDYVPRALLIAEAGGRVANIGLDTYDYRNMDFLATHPAHFDELMSVINSVH